MKGFSAVQNAFVRLHEYHVHLLTLAREKTAMIRKNSVKDLHEIVRREQKAIRELRKLERERQQTVETLTVNICPADVRAEMMNDWLPYLADQERSALEVLRDQLREVIEALRIQNALNQQLLGDSLAVVQTTLRALQSSTDAVAYSPITKVSGRSDQAPPISMFDSKA